MNDVYKSAGSVIVEIAVSGTAYISTSEQTDARKLNGHLYSTSIPLLTF